MTLADLIIEHGPFTPGDVVLASFANQLLHVGGLNALRDELIAARKARENRDRLTVLAVPGDDDDDQLLISCSRCPWIVVLEGTATLAELNRRADEHTEEWR
jgi:hypothetical protein